MQKNNIATICLVIIVFFITGAFVRLAKPVLLPLFFAIFLSFLLSPVLNLLDRLKVPQAIAIIFVLLVTFLLIYLLGSLFYSSGKTAAVEFPKYGQRISTIFESIQELLNRPDWNFEDWVSHLEFNKIGGFLLSSLGPFFSFMGNLFLIFIFLVFILAGRGRIEKKVLHAFNKRQAAKLISVVKKIDQDVQKYLVIKTAVSFVTGLLATIVLVLFDVDFAILFGFLTFLLNFIPNIGSFIATAFPVVITAFQFETLWPAFWVLIVLVLIQQVMGTFLEPRFMGEGLDLSPLLVLFILFFWGWLWGISGMIIAVPFAAIVKIIFSNIPDMEFMAIMMSKG